MSWTPFSACATKADANNKLTSTKQQTVTKRQEQGKQVIAIEPTDPETLYVPYYDPAVVYGAWPYPEYPPYYWGYPGYIGAGLIGAGLAFGAGWALGNWGSGGNYWGGGCQLEQRQYQHQSGRRVNPSRRQQLAAPTGASARREIQQQ